MWKRCEYTGVCPGMEMHLGDAEDLCSCVFIALCGNSSAQQRRPRDTRHGCEKQGAEHRGAGGAECPSAGGIVT